MADGGFLADELGFSFYPSSSNQPPNRLDAFRKTVEAAHRELKRPVFIAEFGYPAGQVTEGAFKSWNHALEGYPLTADWQASLIEDVVSWEIGAGVSGIRPWAPDLPVPGWEPFALFAMDGNTSSARAGLDAMRRGAGSRK